MNSRHVVDILLDDDWGATPHGLCYASEPSTDKSDDGEYLSRFLAPPNDPSLKGYCENEHWAGAKGPIEIWTGNYGGWRLLWKSPAGTYIGVVQGVSRGGRYVASNIYVVPTFRGQGIAQRLMQFAQEWKPRMEVSGALSGPGAKFVGFSPS